jgi:outer membrane protein OmpA-like peptidoglycan-associated protein
MRLKLLLLLAGSLLFLSTQGQDRKKLTSANADCSGIIDLLANDTVFGPTTAPIGFGTVKEISGEKNSLYDFEKEHNTVWYRFRVPVDCSLTFDVIPVSLKDDYDFLLFKFTGKTFCTDILNKKLKPVRTCISRYDPAIGCRTGLNMTATDEFVHSGPGASYCKYVTAKKGDVFVLILDNVYPGGSGHTLKLHYLKGTTPVQQNQNNQQTQIAGKSTLSVTIIDKETKEEVKATAKLYNKKKSGNTLASAHDSITSFTDDLSASSSYIVKIEAPKYFDYSKDIITTNVAENIVINAQLDRIVVGRNVIFDNILFFGNEARLLPESNPVLESLAETMKKNPKLVIEIQGHVNCPTTWEACDDKKMEDYNNTLSVNRAKEVYDYLIESGIDPSRLSYKGFGASRMIYPDARSEEKMKLNRRVEIVIVAN